MTTSRHRALFPMCLLAAALALAATACAPTAGSPAPTAYPLTLDAPAYAGATRPVAGLDATAAPTPAVERTLGPLPASTVGSWDGASVVVYDLQSGRRIDLGPGRIGPIPGFSPDGTKFAWLAGSAQEPAGGNLPPALEVRVLDLATGAQRGYGMGMYAWFVDNDTLTVAREGPDGGPRNVDLATGTDGPPRGPTTPPGSAPNPFRLHYPGYLIAREHAPLALPAADAPYVVVPDDGGPALRFQVRAVVPDPASPHVVFALEDGPAAHEQRLFRVDVDTATASLIATGDADGYDGTFALNRTEVAVGDRLCHDDGRILVYRFDTGQVTALHTNVPPVRSTGGDGLYVDGSGLFARARLDPTTFAYDVVLPAPGLWSRDGRWAAVGQPALGPLPADPCAASTAP